jgi:hypothetical protein
MLGTIEDALLHMWVFMLNYLTPIMLFVLLNVVVGTIIVTSQMSQNNNTNEDLKRNPSLLYRLSIVILFRDKVEEVTKFKH